MTLYRKGRYQVQIEADGAIRVKPGDWLSKYSVAIWNDFLHIREYGRRNRQGSIEPVANPNLIFAGETLYHLPTWQASRQPRQNPPRLPLPPMSEVEKKRIILDFLKKDFNLRGEHLPYLSKAIDIVGYTDNALTLMEIAGLLAEGGALAATSEVVAIASTLLFPVGATIELVNAWQTGQRMYGMRAIAYTITAWAFDDPIPSRSQEVITNVSQMFPNEIPDYDRAWRDASGRTLNNL